MIDMPRAALWGYFRTEVTMSEEKKLAVLIDSDNVSAKYAQFVMNEVQKYGVPTNPVTRCPSCSSSSVSRVCTVRSR